MAIMQKHLVQSSETCVRQLTAFSSRRVQRQNWIVEDHDPPLLFLKHRAQAVGHNSFTYLNPKGIASIMILMWAKCRTQKKILIIYIMHMQIFGETLRPTSSQQVLTRPGEPSAPILTAL